MKYFIGIDEVGRGCIAGPIAFCAFVTKDQEYQILTPKEKVYYLKNQSYRDSKRLNDKQRRQEFKELQNQKDLYKTFVVYNSAENIDKFGLSIIINKSLKTLITKLIKYYIVKEKNIKHKTFYITLDGGLKIKETFINKITTESKVKLKWQSIIKGDENNINIRNASIIAKVKRDNYMKKLNKKIISNHNINYGLDKHVGYGTKYHYSMIKQYGTTKYHRQTWIK